MDNTNKSVAALNRAFAKLGKKGFDEIINKIDSIPNFGPTVEEYFTEFETHYADLIEEMCAINAEVSVCKKTFKVENMPIFPQLEVNPPYPTYWREKPEKTSDTENNSTTVQNNGGFLFRFVP